MNTTANDTQCWFGKTSGVRCTKVGAWKFAAYRGCSDDLRNSRYCDEHHGNNSCNVRVVEACHRCKVSPVVAPCDAGAAYGFVAYCDSCSGGEFEVSFGRTPGDAIAAWNEAVELRPNPACSHPMHDDDCTCGHDAITEAR